MLKNNPGIKRQLFVEKKRNSEPFTLKNLTPGEKGISFFNTFQKSFIEDAINKVDFKADTGSLMSLDDIKSNLLAALSLYKDL